MATPEAPRPPELGMARALNKSGPGQQQGRMTGLSPVPRRDGSRVRRASDPGGIFTQRYVALTRVTTQNWGNELPITFTAETTHGSPIDFRGGNAVPTSLPNLSVTQPYAVTAVVRVTTVPTDLHVEIRGNFGAIYGLFTKTAASKWTAVAHGVVVPDVTALSTISVVGAGVGADVTADFASLTIYPLLAA